MSGFYEYNNGRRNKDLEDYKERLCEERKQLSERIEKLRLYLNSQKAFVILNTKIYGEIPSKKYEELRRTNVNISLLEKQYLAMTEYMDILEQRASLFDYQLDACNKIMDE